MNARTPETAHQAHRWRNGGVAGMAVLTPAERSARAYRGIRKALSVYADTDAARRLRSSDIARKRRMSDAEWRRLQARREKQFGLPVGSLGGRKGG